MIMIEITGTNTIVIESETRYTVDVVAAGTERHEQALESLAGG